MSRGFALPDDTPEDPLDSPEVLIINALLEAPEGFRPDRYGVSKEMLSCWEKPWSFCVEHQRTEGHPPSRELFARTFPDFELLRGVKPAWAAEKLRSAYRDRTMRKEVRTALNLLNSGSVDDAQEILRRIARPQGFEVVEGLDVLDPATVDDDKAKIAYPTMWPYLNHLTKGGVGLGELWYIAARFGHGKSWKLPCYGVAMAEAGATVAIASLEMPKRSYVRRIHKILARNDMAVLSRLGDRDRAVRTDALASIPKLSGKIQVFDPGDMTMDMRAIRRLAGDFQYILIDHMGLMLSSDGVAAIKDWRVAAEISNESKRITLEERCGIVGAVQVNREGETKGSFLPPKPSNIAGTDDLGRDADVLVMMSRMGERSMLQDIPKNRGGVAGRFYSMFEPDLGMFDEISKDTALDRARKDKERLADI